MSKSKSLRPSSLHEIKHFESKLKKIYWNKLKKKLPIFFADTTNTKNAEQIKEVTDKITDAENQIHGFDTTDLSQILEQYKKGKSSRVEFTLPPIFFPSDTKTVASVPYLKVSISSSLSDAELPHFLSSKTRNS